MPLLPRSDDHRRLLGRALDQLGRWTLPLGIGVAIGYWVGDFGVPWLPTVLETLVALLGASLIFLVTGHALRRRLVRAGTAGPIPRKRTIAFVALALVVAIGRLAIFWLQQPSPLTELDPSTLDRTLTLDGERIRALDAELEALIGRLEGTDAFDHARSTAPLSATDEALLRDSWSAIYDLSFALDQLRAFHEDWFRFDLGRDMRPYFLHSFLLTYSAELSLFEKSGRLDRLLRRNPQASTFLDAPHPDLGFASHSLSRFLESFLGTRDQARVVGFAQYLAGLDTLFDAHGEAVARGLDPLWRRLDAQRARIGAMGLIDRAGATVRADTQLIRRSVRRVWFPTQKAIAEWMGDTRTRRVGRYLIDTEQVRAAGAALEPGDVLLSRKNWYLSNVGLPGFWPHAILHIGAPEAFDHYFDDPAVLTWLASRENDATSLGAYLAERAPEAWARYRAGRDGRTLVVIEAVAEGVVLNSLPEAAGDYLAALRPRLDKVAKAQAIVEAFSHLGKPYDFDFDFATDHALVCTELVWRSYRPAPGKQGLVLPTRRIAGRLTLPANVIAELYDQEQGTAEARFDFVLFLDAREAEGRAVLADEPAFRRSHQRLKWDIAQR